MCVIFFFLVFCVQWTTGWWEEGHMLVAEIATSQLSPELLNSINDFLSKVAPFFPDSPDILTSSAWPDYLKTENVSAFDTWHYYDGIYNPTNISGILPPSPVGNVVWALAQAVTTLNGSKATLWGKSTMIRFLLHFVGDIHQPLHAMELFDSQFTEGDAGGNRFFIFMNNTKWNLHSFWDSAGTKFQTSYTKPLTDEERAIIHSKANKLINTWPYDYFGKNVIQNLNFTQWQQESFQLGIKYVYLNYQLKFNEAISSQYLEDTQNIASRQITLAGYRLGELLKRLLALHSDTILCTSQSDEDPSQLFLLILTCMGGFLLGTLVMGFYQYKKRGKSKSGMKESGLLLV